MKLQSIIYILAFIVLAACNNAQSERIYYSGVSKELASQRKENIDKLEYSLQFCIPQKKDSAVLGSMDIDFRIRNKQDLIIDFWELENVREVHVNDETCSYELRNEHIIIAASDLREGDNCVHIEFVAGNQSLNRSDEFMYTLLVPDRARTVFPCLDQPDMKAIFNLSLSLPQEWTAVSNSPISSETVEGDCRLMSFKPTEPLSTYLFSFVAGIFESQTYDDGRHRFTAYHRETDPERIAQLPTIFDQVAMSLDWLEEYTGIDYPFAKYDFIILPGFQYGGMEHTGATLYNDTRMFLSKNPTPDEELGRVQLIAHETAHMWFGDFVTMKWFDNVWMKEVFANYFASRITEPLYPDINHRLNWLKNITTSALNEDRTKGGTAIRQPLDNMSSAGLIYNNIIYNKAPVMLEKLVEIMGEEQFRAGIHDYLSSYSYDNAAWDDLINILDERCEQDLAAFSDVWVNSKGMPFIDFSINGDRLMVKQSDPYGRGLTWPQSFKLCLVGKKMSEIEVNISGETLEIPIGDKTSYILPNSDGRGYGYFRYDDASIEWILKNWYRLEDETCRQSQLMNLNESFQHGIIDAHTWLNSLMEGLPFEKDPLIASTVCAYIAAPLAEVKDRSMEKQILTLSDRHAIQSCRLQLLRALIPSAENEEVCEEIYRIWSEASHPLLSENDYMNMAYELAIRRPQQQKEIIAEQAARISNPDRRRQFDFVARATDPDVRQQEELFHSLLKAENRRIEPWALRTLGYLCHPTREEQAVKYIREALESLPYIQRTSDIFFPQNWCATLLKARYSPEALKEVEDFINDDSELSELLKSKILQASWNLERRATAE